MATSASAGRGREVRQRLLRSAAELIAERGWGAVSTRVVAAHAGVGPGLVHYHFASLQDLLTQAALGTMRGLVDELTDLLDRAGSPEEGLEMIVALLNHYEADDPASVLFSEAYLAATRDDELRRAIGDVVERARRPLARWLAGHGVRDAEPTAAVLAAALDGLMLHRALGAGLATGDITSVLRRTLRPEPAVAPAPIREPAPESGAEPAPESVSAPVPPDGVRHDTQGRHDT